MSSFVMLTRLQARAGTTSPIVGLLVRSTARHLTLHHSPPNTADYLPYPNFAIDITAHRPFHPLDPHSTHRSTVMPDDFSQALWSVQMANSVLASTANLAADLTLCILETLPAVGVYTLATVTDQPGWVTLGASALATASGVAARSLIAQAGSTTRFDESPLEVGGIAGTNVLANLLIGYYAYGYPEQLSSQAVLLPAIAAAFTAQTLICTVQQARERANEVLRLQQGAAK